MTQEAAWIEEMEAIAVRHNGLLRPADIVAFAKNKHTALHKKFTWDDSEAAYQYRLWQARELIAVAVVELPQTGKTYRAFVSMPDDRGEEGGGYRTLVSIMSDKEQRARLLAHALAEFDRWKDKYESLNELADVFEARKRVRRQ